MLVRLVLVLLDWYWILSFCIWPWMVLFITLVVWVRVFLILCCFVWVFVCAYLVVGLLFRLLVWVLLADCGFGICFWVFGLVAFGGLGFFGGLVDLCNLGFPRGLNLVIFVLGLWAVYSLFGLCFRL